jgi:hypothetical protein
VIACAASNVSKSQLQDPSDLSCSPPIRKNPFATFTSTQLAGPLWTAYQQGFVLPTIVTTRNLGEGVSCRTVWGPFRSPILLDNGENDEGEPGEPQQID